MAKKMKWEKKIDRTRVDNQLKEAQQEWREARQNIFEHRSFIPNIYYDDFFKLFKLNAEILLFERGEKTEYKIDDYNKSALSFICTYLQKCEGVDHKKGIMIVGDIGTGKTLMLKTAIKIIEKHTIKRFKQLHSKEVAEAIKEAESGIRSLKKMPMLIDDIGKEQKEAKDYGSAFNPIPDLFALRWDFGSWTFATCNYNFDDLVNFYGRSTVDRMNQMFNIITLKGESRRK